MCEDQVAHAVSTVSSGPGLTAQSEGKGAKRRRTKIRLPADPSRAICGIPFFVFNSNSNDSSGSVPGAQPMQFHPCSSVAAVRNWPSSLGSHLDTEQKNKSKGSFCIVPPKAHDPSLFALFATSTSLYAVNPRPDHHGSQQNDDSLTGAPAVAARNSGQKRATRERRSQRTATPHGLVPTLIL
jgi:hypothetical protein